METKLLNTMTSNSNGRGDKETVDTSSSSGSEDERERRLVDAESDLILISTDSEEKEDVEQLTKQLTVQGACKRILKADEEDYVSSVPVDCIETSTFVIDTLALKDRDDLRIHMAGAIKNNRVQRDYVSVQMSDDCLTDTDFENKLLELKPIWNLRECESRKTTEAAFYTWFLTYKKNLVQNCLLLPLRICCGFGVLHSTTYANECLNNRLKQKTDYQENEVTVFCTNMRELADEQKIDTEKAIIELSKVNMPKHPQRKPNQKPRSNKRKPTRDFGSNPNTVPSASMEDLESDNGGHQIQFLIGTHIRSYYDCGQPIRLPPHIPPPPYDIGICQKE
ncbi:unnamed protein product [Mytilus coruscus]|uniref:Uncharacterized protein n=1 Tax=Mytilus coruscus TaxID=42192 RepID=A0A6J8CJR7_MYTCO|nr:unnamed protein product [Mytilus coruscus]